MTESLLEDKKIYQQFWKLNSNLTWFKHFPTLKKLLIYCSCGKDIILNEYERYVPVVRNVFYPYIMCDTCKKKWKLNWESGEAKAI